MTRCGMLLAVDQVILQRWNFNPTTLGCLRAAGVEWAARRGIDGTRHIALKRDPLGFPVEVGNRNRLHSDVIKRLTGGDSISARALYSNVVVQQIPMFTPIIATNSMPTIEDGDAALWRRLLVLPFDTSVPLGSIKTNPSPPMDFLRLESSTLSDSGLSMVCSKQSK